MMSERGRSRARSGPSSASSGHRTVKRPPPYQTNRHVSSGGVILRQHNGTVEICLIVKRLDGRLVWGLPKGHVEPGETPQATAVREVREETGLVGEPMGDLGSITYWFIVKQERVRYFKTVHFYLLRYISGRTSDHDHEVDDAVWLPFDEAMTRISYDNERRILAKAKRCLNQIELEPLPT